MKEAVADCYMGAVNTSNMIWYVVIVFVEVNEVYMGTVNYSNKQVRKGS